MFSVRHLVVWWAMMVVLLVVSNLFILKVLFVLVGRVCLVDVARRNTVPFVDSWICGKLLLCDVFVRIHAVDNGVWFELTPNFISSPSFS